LKSIQSCATVSTLHVEPAPLSRLPQRSAIPQYSLAVRIREACMLYLFAGTA